MTQQAEAQQVEAEHVRERMGDAPRGPQARGLQARGPVAPPERTPPQNVDLEMCVLGGIMIEPQAGYPLAADYLTPSSFYLEGNGLLFELMGGLHQRGIPPDCDSVLDELIARGLLDKVGGSGVVLGMLNAVPTAANLDQHARKVAEKQRLRMLIRQCSELIDEAYRQETPSGELAALMQECGIGLMQRGKGGEVQGIGELLATRLPEIEARIAEQDEAHAAGKRRAVPRGAIASDFSELDRLTGGFNAGELWYVGAYTSVGKTSLALSMLHSMARYQGLRCGMLTLEMSPSRLTDRLLCISSSCWSDCGAAGWLTPRALRSGELSMQQRKVLADSRRALDAARLSLDYGSGLMINEVCARLRRLHQRAGCQVLVMDHLHLIRARGAEGASAGEIESWAQALQAVASATGAVLIVPAQLSRPQDKLNPPRPTMPMLKGSGGIEQSADGVLLLHRKNYGRTGLVPLGQADPAELIVAKNRDGDTREIELDFLGPVMRFVNHSEVGR
jgi:replicative DNA helicase